MGGKNSVENSSECSPLRIFLISRGLLSARKVYSFENSAFINVSNSATFKFVFDIVPDAAVRYVKRIESALICYLFLHRKPHEESPYAFE